MSDDLVRLYTDDTSCRVVLIGGPGDGTSMTCTQDPPPALLRLPVEQPASALLDSPDAPCQPLPIAAYAPVLDESGFHSCSDGGTYRYEYRGQ